MMYCSKCKKVSYGSELCYNCYQENIKKNLVKIDPYFNMCIKCSKTINKELYCEHCYKKNIPLKIEQIARDYSSIWRYKTENPSENQKLTEYSNRNCISCNKQAKIGSYFCDEHQINNIKENLKNIENEENAENYDYVNDNRNETSYKIIRNIDLELLTLIKLMYNESESPTKNNNIEKYQNNLKYTCKNGILVRSISEREISNFLSENGIDHTYEKEFKYSSTNIFLETKKKKTLHPDFFIEGPVYYKQKLLKNVYIEFWGLKTEKYLEQKKYKLNVYKQIGVTLINLYNEDIENLEKSLDYKLLNFKDNQINF